MRLLVRYLQFRGPIGGSFTHGAFPHRRATVFDSPFGHSTIMFNMKHLNKHSLRYSSDAEHAEDYDLWERAHQLVGMANVPEFLQYYRVHPSQVSDRKSAAQRLSLR